MPDVADAETGLLCLLRLRHCIEGSALAGDSAVVRVSEDCQKRHRQARTCARCWWAHVRLSDESWKEMQVRRGLPGRDYANFWVLISCRGCGSSVLQPGAVFPCRA